MGNSRTACFIGMHESAIMRLQGSGGEGFTLTGCSMFPFGRIELASGKGKRLLKKLSRHLKKLRSDSIALCITPETYLPLQAYFAPEATAEEFRMSCSMEAEHFLNCPGNYHCDVTGSGNEPCGGIHEKKLLLFYPSEPARTLSNHLSQEHPVLFSCSPQLSLLHLSKHAEGPQALLELENSFTLLTVARKGRVEKLACRQVKNREEAVYFTIRELSANPLFRETGIQVSGTVADEAMTALIERETRVKTKPPGIPSGLKLFNPERFPVSSEPAVIALSTALMAFSADGTTTFLQ
jgi:hypothetical protein